MGAPASPPFSWVEFLVSLSPDAMARVTGLCNILALRDHGQYSPLPPPEVIPPPEASGPPEDADEDNQQDDQEQVEDDGDGSGDES